MFMGLLYTSVNKLSNAPAAAAADTAARKANVHFLEHLTAAQLHYSWIAGVDH